VDWKGRHGAHHAFDEKGAHRFRRVERFVNWQIERGSIVPCGDNRESATLSGDERKAVTAAVVRRPTGACP
jgi:dihydrodipicolinate synthase/N-acetylneuraminate lyase